MKTEKQIRERLNKYRDKFEKMNKAELLRAALQLGKIEGYEEVLSDD